MAKILMVHRVISNIKAPTAYVQMNLGSHRAAATMPKVQHIKHQNPCFMVSGNYSFHTFSCWDLNPQPQINCFGLNLQLHLLLHWIHCTIMFMSSLQRCGFLTLTYAVCPVGRNGKRADPHHPLEAIWR